MKKFESLFIRGANRYSVNVAGDSLQQSALSNLVGPRRQERLNIKVRAQLALQDDDPQVLVLINGQQVGYLSHANGEAFQRIVRYGERSPHEAFECAAVIRGVVGQLHIRLDLPFED